MQTAERLFYEDDVERLFYQHNREMADQAGGKGRKLKVMGVKKRYGGFQVGPDETIQKMKELADEWEGPFDLGNITRQGALEQLRRLENSDLAPKRTRRALGQGKGWETDFKDDIHIQRAAFLWVYNEWSDFGIKRKEVKEARKVALAALGDQEPGLDWLHRIEGTSISEKNRIGWIAGLWVLAYLQLSGRMPSAKAGNKKIIGALIDQV